jgi:hypothetical protein
MRVPVHTLVNPTSLGVIGAVGSRAHVPTDALEPANAVPASAKREGECESESGSADVHGASSVVEETIAPSGCSTAKREQSACRRLPLTGEHVFV